MKINFPAIQLLIIGFLVIFATSCEDKVKEEELTPKTIEECEFFTAKYSKDQVWEVEFDQESGGYYGEDFEVGKTTALTIVGPARTMYSPQSESSQPVNWGTASDRYLQFKIVKNEYYGEIIDDIKNDSATNIIPMLFEKNGSMSEDYSSSLTQCNILARGAEGCIVRFHSPEEMYYLFFSTKKLSNPTAINLMPTQGYVKKLSELGNGKIETQLDKLNKVLPTAGGVSSVVFKSGVTYGTMTDLNGNTYKTITIGTQTWMAENLRTTKYRNGESISIVNLGADWGSDRTTEACCSYLNTTDKNLIATQGLLYNAYAVNDSRNIAPKGWRVPTKEEWQVLIEYLGGSATAGNKMKEAGILHWSETDPAVTNASGFSCVPTGARNIDNGGVFYEQSTTSTTFASSTTRSDDNAMIWACYLYNNTGEVNNDYYRKSETFSVRLIKE